MKVDVSVRIYEERPQECWELERRYYGVSCITIRKYYFKTEREAKLEKKRQQSRKHEPYSLRFWIRRVA